MDHAEFLSLRDDELLAVLSYLSAKELLQCRQVCCRLRDLCLHASLWHPIQLYYCGSEKDVVLRALRIAPCLRSIYLNSIDLNVLATVLTSSCVIARLAMKVKKPTKVSTTIAFLMKVSSLGGLRELDIDIDCKILPEHETLLYVILYSLNDLTELKLRCNSSLPTGFPSPKEMKPSLTSLDFTNSEKSSVTFLEMLLKGHVVTLTSIRLNVKNDAPVSLLKMIPNLKSLTCPPVDALSELHSVQTLVEIDIIASPAYDVFPPGALEFLRRAPQLRCVSLSLPKENPAAPLLALRESPSASCVESLYLFEAHGCLEAVASSLHHFPSLQTLEVEAVASNSLLRAVNPTSSPHLTTLEVSIPEGICPHEWLHGPVQDVLVCNPSLHLCVWNVWISEDCACLWCAWGCHAELKTNDFSSFSSHRRNASCPKDCFQVVSRLPLL